jgi:hypothetical protein
MVPILRIRGLATLCAASARMGKVSLISEDSAIVFSLVMARLPGRRLEEMPLCRDMLQVHKSFGYSGRILSFSRPSRSVPPACANRFPRCVQELAGLAKLSALE